MTILSGWRARRTIETATPKSPWGSGDDAGKDGPDRDGTKDGTRNPWSVPPAGKRSTPGPSALDEFLRRARGSGGGGGWSGGGLPGAPGPRALWGIGAGLIILAWLVFTSFHSIGPQQRGVVTWFGAYAGTLDPGVRLTPPAPFADVTKVDVSAIRTERFPDGGDAENLMLTGDQNIVNLSYSVRWNIANPEDFVFQIKDQQSTVRSTAESAMREVVANMKLDDAIGAGRSRIEAQVQDRMQRILDGYKSGVRIQGVAVNSAVPPKEVSDAFKDVTAAQQDAVAARNNAQGYAQQLIRKAEGEAAEFDKVYSQYKLAPEVTRRRMYYETMEDVLAKNDKTIIETNNVMPYLPLPGARRAPNPQTGAAKVNRAWLKNPVALGIVAMLVLIAIASTLTIVPETKQVVVLRFEQPIRTVNSYKASETFGNSGAGLIARVPFVDRLVWVDKRVLDVDYDNQQVLSSDQLPLVVDAYARFRVIDPLRMVISARSEAGVTDALRPLLGTSIRNELGNQPFATLLSPERDQVMDNIQTRLQKLASQYGVQIVDVRIKHADLPEGSPLQRALARMQSARVQQALTIRAEGGKQAQIIRADAQAQAAKIYADAFNQDADFYDFYRAMQSYRHTFGADNGPAPEGSTSIILAPDNAYLKQFLGRK